MESYITFAYLANKLRLINRYSLTRYVSGIFWLHSDFLVECSMLCNKGFTVDTGILEERLKESISSQK